ncbi:MAG: hypothetical protein ACR2IB_08795 [Pyrinomonadaceae bacterium]
MDDRRVECQSGKASAKCRVSGVGQAAASIALSLLCLGLLCLGSAYGQETQGEEIQSPEKAHAHACPDPPPQTSGSHGFRRVGETIDIPLNVADCQPIAFVLRWSNGRNNGSNLIVTFLDSMNQPIHSRALSGFLTGTFEFPFASLDQQPWFARGSIVAVPSTIVIQAVQPFAPPANISYTVTRKAARVRSRPRAEVQPAALSKALPISARAQVLDDQVAMKLRTAEGRLLSQGQASLASGSAASIRYKLEEVALPEPRVMETHGRRENVRVAYRLTLAVELRSSQKVGTVRLPSLSKVGLIWLDDAALPAFSTNSQEISTLIYDLSVLRDGAEIAVSSADGSQMYSLAERLKYESKVQRLTSEVKTDSESKVQATSTSNVQPRKEGEEGNQVVGIRSAVRVIGATRMPLVQIELRTSRPFPPRHTALQLQVGKRFFLNELTGDHTGRTLTLTLTQEMFAELNQGGEIVAFFDKRDRSGFADVWHFGRLDKGSRQ